MKTRKGLLLLLFSATSALLSARSAYYSSKAYSLSIQYTDEICPGDAVIFNMTVTEGSESIMSLDGTAFIKLIRDATGKSPGDSPLFTVNHSPLVMYGAIPLSTYLEEGTFSLKVTYTVTNGIRMEFSLPVTVTSKDFVEEVLYLNETNTAIKTDNSPQRAAQIDKLNAILDTTDTSNIYYDGPFSYPVTSTRRTSFFGDRRTYKYNTGKKETSLHYGIDFGVPEGTPVTACGAGKVVLAEWRNSTGWSIVIAHMPGLYSLYYHLSKMEVSEGDYVEKGEEIALSGSTGLATGPHLHWEVRLYMNAVNPDQFVETTLF
ncbi:MAG: M23 family metallopeptidase [Treponema sp.]|nr:M23 family metallopeptidase [Candidatus Treponema caballi]